MRGARRQPRRDGRRYTASTAVGPGQDRRSSPPGSTRRSSRARPGRVADHDPGRHRRPHVLADVETFRAWAGLPGQGVTRDLGLHPARLQPAAGGLRGKAPPPAARPARPTAADVGLLRTATAADQATATQIARYANRVLLHAPLPGAMTLPSYAFASSPPETDEASSTSSRSATRSTSTPPPAGFRTEREEIGQSPLPRRTRRAHPLEECGCLQCTIDASSSAMLWTSTASPPCRCDSTCWPDRRFLRRPPASCRGDPPRPAEPATTSASPSRCAGRWSTTPTCTLARAATSPAADRSPAGGPALPPSCSIRHGNLDAPCLLGSTPWFADQGYSASLMGPLRPRGCAILQHAEFLSSADTALTAVLKS